MIQLFTLEDAEKWDEIVKSFQRYDVYYLSGYVKAFEQYGDGTAALIYFTSQSTRAINALMLRDIADDPFFSQHLEKNTCFDMVTPYGYGGFLIEGDDTDTLEQEYGDFAVSHGIVSEFVRFHSMLENYQKVESIYDEIFLGNTVYIDTSDSTEIWSNLTSKNRNMIRKAQKSGMKVYWGRDESLIPKFMEIYNATMAKDNATDYYFFDEPFYESILHDLKYNAMWFYSMLNGEVASIAIFMFDNGQMHYHLSASRREYQHLAPSNLMIYEAALWANRNGYKTLHLGGGVGCKEDSLYKFKKAFNRGEDRSFYIGKKIFNKDAYQRLVDLKGDLIENHRFFPAYRG